MNHNRGVGLVRNECANDPVRGGIHTVAMSFARGAIAALVAVEVLSTTGCATYEERVNSAVEENDKSAMTPLLAPPYTGDTALKVAIGDRNYAMCEFILKTLQRENRVQQVLDKTIGILEYDAAFTTSMNDGYTYLAIRDVPGIDLLHRAIEDKDERLARMLMQYGAKCGQTYYEDLSGLSFFITPGWSPRSQIEHVDRVTDQLPGGKVVVWVKGHLQTQSEKRKGTLYKTYNHASVARQSGLLQLATEIESAGK